MCCHQIRNRRGRCSGAEAQWAFVLKVADFFFFFFFFLFKCIFNFFFFLLACTALHWIDIHAGSICFLRSSIRNYPESKSLFLFLLDAKKQRCHLSLYKSTGLEWHWPCRIEARRHQFSSVTDLRRSPPLPSPSCSFGLSGSNNVIC